MKVALYRYSEMRYKMALRDGANGPGATRLDRFVTSNNSVVAPGLPSSRGDVVDVVLRAQRPCRFVLLDCPRLATHRSSPPCARQMEWDQGCRYSRLTAISEPLQRSPRECDCSRNNSRRENAEEEPIV
ncbi:hypothetical protein HPB47_011574 [Ixodes persulcatus]|uniref:Uncharacterized protein n=1 Tax=Ixodes persulcatus TaxID=34615 RepID=A0AC60NW30_IXOPE|nr:hypothetical protein HPB47_011574 [Ixodes persulcatus]